VLVEPANADQRLLAEDLFRTRAPPCQLALARVRARI